MIPRRRLPSPGPSPAAAERRLPGHGPGFTLLETMVVLLLLGIAAAAVVPDLGALLRPGPAATARELAGAYRRARAAATDRGRVVIVTLDLRTGAWRSFAGPTGAAGEAVAGGNLLTDRAGIRLSAKGAGTAVARFGPDGTARAPTVHVRSSRGRWAVSVDPWTGAVHVRR